MAAAGQDPSGVNPSTARPVYHLRGRSKKREREETRTAGATSEGAQAEDAKAEGAQTEGAADADADWQAREHAYHRDLLEALRHPSMWQALGWPGPPDRIGHSSLQDNLNTWRLLL